MLHVAGNADGRYARIQRAPVARGTAADEVIRHVRAPLYYRLLVLGEPLTPEAADLAARATATAALAGVFTTWARGQPRSRIR